MSGDHSLSHSDAAGCEAVTSWGQVRTYSGLGLETRDSGEYHFVQGQLRRRKKQATIRGLNKDHNHDLKALFKAAATRASIQPDLSRTFTGDPSPKAVHSSPACFSAFVGRDRSEVARLPEIG